MRLATGDPEKDYLATLASNKMIGEAYIALQHHYQLSKTTVRHVLGLALQSGLVAPCNGLTVLEALLNESGCGLLDRLIADDYARQGLQTLTNDKRMAKLAACVRL